MAGKCIEKISVNHLVCVSDGCMSRSSFNKDYLSSAYPDDTIQNILLGTEIYDGQGKVKIAEGFEQNINDGHVEIKYSVTPHAIYFKDKKNNILLNIKDTE
jgi:hypothetical protein